MNPSFLMIIKYSKVRLVKAMVFPVVMYGCESWTIKKAENRRINAFELWWWRTLESPLDCKEIQPVHPKGNQSWIFFGRTDVEAEIPVLWPPDMKSWLFWNYPDAGKDWRQEEKGTTGDELVGWHHWLDGHELEQALGVSDRQGNLVCFSPQGHKESDLTEQLNWLKWLKLKFEKNLNSIYNKIKKQHALSWTSIFPICSRVLFFFYSCYYCCIVVIVGLPFYFKASNKISKMFDTYPLYKWIINCSVPFPPTPSF